MSTLLGLLTTSRSETGFHSNSPMDSCLCSASVQNVGKLEVQYNLGFGGLLPRTTFHPAGRQSPNGAIARRLSLEGESSAKRC